MTTSDTTRATSSPPRTSPPAVIAQHHRRHRCTRRRPPDPEAAVDHGPQTELARNLPPLTTGRKPPEHPHELLPQPSRIQAELTDRQRTTRATSHPCQWSTCHTRTLDAEPFHHFSRKAAPGSAPTPHRKAPPHRPPPTPPPYAASPIPSLRSSRPFSSPACCPGRGAPPPRPRRVTARSPIPTSFTPGAGTPAPARRRCPPGPAPTCRRPSPAPR